MNATIKLYDPREGVTVYTKIAPIIRKGLHKITVTREQDGKKRIANFVVDNEVQAKAFLACVLTGNVHHPKVEEVWRKNFCGELYGQ